MEKKPHRRNIVKIPDIHCLYVHAISRRGEASRNSGDRENAEKDRRTALKLVEEAFEKDEYKKEYRLMGLGGRICKAKFMEDGVEDMLKGAIKWYKRGYEVNPEWLTGSINLATLLTVDKYRNQEDSNLLQTVIWVGITKLWLLSLTKKLKRI